MKEDTIKLIIKLLNLDTTTTLEEQEKVMKALIPNYVTGEDLVRKAQIANGTLPIIYSESYLMQGPLMVESYKEPEMPYRMFTFHGPAVRNFEAKPRGIPEPRCCCRC